MSAQVELWRVSTVEGEFETDLETLKQWIVEGCVLPTDKVSKGNLNWIDAGRAPMLKAAFKGEHVVTVPAQVSAPSTEPIQQVHRPLDQTEAFGPTHEALPSTAQAADVFVRANACHNHPERPPVYQCRMCSVAL